LLIFWTESQSQPPVSCGLSFAPSPHLLFWLDSPLAKALKIPCSIFARAVPENPTSPADITTLSLVYSNLATVPQVLGENPPSCRPGRIPPQLRGPLINPSSFFFPIASCTNLVELDLSHNPLTDSCIAFLVTLINSTPSLTSLRQAAAFFHCCVPSRSFTRDSPPI